MRRISLPNVPRVLAALATVGVFGAPASCAPQPQQNAKQQLNAQKAPAKRATPKPPARKKAPPRVLARVSQSNEELAKLELRMMQMVNAARVANGLVPLGIDEDLADIARAHSLEMRDRDYFAHESPTEKLRHPLDRYRAGIGDTPRMVAENIYRSWGSPQIIDENDVRIAHDALMKSPGHRENIMRPQLTRIGIGFIANQNGDLWVTQMFSRP